MGNLIDRQAAIDVVRDVMLDFIEYEDEIEVPMADTDKQLFSIKKAISKKIKALPSAQPEIIRCKDCKHFAGEGMYCSCDIIVQFDHFYCYYADRRQDE